MGDNAGVVAKIRSSKELLELHDQGRGLTITEKTKIHHKVSPATQKQIEIEAAAVIPLRWEQVSPFRHGLRGNGSPSFYDVYGLLGADRLVAQKLNLQEGDLVIDLGGGSAPLLESLVEQSPQWAKDGAYVDIDGSFSALEIAKTRVDRHDGLGNISVELIKHDFSEPFPVEEIVKIAKKNKAKRIIQIANFSITYAPVEWQERHLNGIDVVGEQLEIPAEKYIHMLADGKFQVGALMRHFFMEIIPNCLVNGKVREARLGLRALPSMARFGKEIPEFAALWSVDDLKETHEARGRRVTIVQETLWKQGVLLKIE